MVRIFGSTGTRRRRRYQLGALVSLVALLALIAVPNALAVHDLGVFQLDKNASTAVNSTPPAAEDWDLICKAHPSTCTFAGGYPVPGGTTVADPSQFVVDPSESQQDDILKGGTKDDNEINTWKWASAKPSPPKNDITHAFAAEYTCAGSAPNSVPGCTGTAGDQLLYFGGDRFSNSGSANLAFWFFQHKITQKLADGTTDAGPGDVCAVSAGCIFGGTHTAGDVSLGGTTPGDLLIISAFGPKAQIQVYEWVGPGNATSPCFTSTCTLEPLIPASAGQACEDVSSDIACATVNDVVTPSPWTLSQKNAPANSFQPTNFFEGGINLTNLGFANACFSSFLMNTRSSAAGNAELHDKIIGQFARCGASLKTHVSTTEVPIGGSLTDDATITVTGTGTPLAPTGTVSFFVCGPGASSCDTSGTPFDTKPLSGAVQVGNEFTVTSASFMPNAAGTWCFAASWPGDSNYTDGPYRDDGSNECFTVTPRQPNISTSQTAGPLPLGSSISDTATLGNTAPKPNGDPADGTIVITAYGPSDPNCTGAAVFTSSPLAVSGDGTYGPVSFIANASTGGAGTYHWIATYSGDLPNTLGVASNCADEASVIISLQPEMTTAQRFVPNDSATVTVASGGGNLAGTVRFRLYDNATCSPAGTTLYDKTFDIVTDGTGTGLSRTVSTDNTTAYTSDMTFSWLVEYVSTNAGHTNVTATCNAEHSSITIVNDGTFNTP